MRKTARKKVNMNRYLVTWINKDGNVHQFYRSENSKKDVRESLKNTPYYQIHLSKIKSIKLDNNKLVLLDNDGPVKSICGDEKDDSYFPRLQVNNLGEIILATSKSRKYGLTSGILVGKTPESKSTLGIGTKFTDWEVCGDLTDYSGPVTITFENEVQSPKET